MVKRKTKNIIAWSFITIGLLGVFVPHISSLIGMAIDLNLPSHSWSEVISAIIIFIGVLFKK